MSPPSSRSTDPTRSPRRPGVPPVFPCLPGGSHCPRKRPATVQVSSRAVSLNRAAPTGAVSGSRRVIPPGVPVAGGEVLAARMSPIPLRAIPSQRRPRRRFAAPTHMVQSAHCRMGTACNVLVTFAPAIAAREFGPQRQLARERGWRWSASQAPAFVSSAAPLTGARERSPGARSRLQKDRHDPHLCALEKKRAT
jgi:hypothetical protein